MAQMNRAAYQILLPLNWSLIKIVAGFALALINFPYYEETIHSHTHTRSRTHNINIQLLLSLIIKYFKRLFQTFSYSSLLEMLPVLIMCISHYRYYP